MFRLSSNLLAALAVLSAFSAASPTSDTDVESIAEPLPVADAGIISGTVEARADISASFNTFKGDNCGDANFLQTHNPKQAKVCHKLAANEKSLDVYFVKSGCTLYFYSDSKCSRGAAYAPADVACEQGAPGYNSYQVIC